MKSIWPLILLLLASSSCTTREPVQILDEYEIPITSNRDMRYYYHRLPENDTVVYEFKTTNEGGKKYVTELATIRSRPYGKRKFRVTSDGKEMIENIFYSIDSATNKQESSPGEILENSRIGDGDRYEGGKFVVSHTIDLGMVARTTNVERLIGEEMYEYNGKKIPAIRFESDFHMRFYNVFFPFAWWTTKYEGHVIYGKGIGLMYFRAASDDGTVMEHRLTDWEFVGEEEKVSSAAEVPAAQNKEPIQEDDCVFDNDYQTLTTEWLRECGVYHYEWDMKNHRAIIINELDSVFVSRGGCYHFGTSAEIRFAADPHGIHDSTHWIMQSLALAEKFRFNHYAEQIKAGNVVYKQNNSESAWFEVPDDDDTDNLEYVGIEVRVENGIKRISIGEYYN